MMQRFSNFWEDFGYIAGVMLCVLAAVGIVIYMAVEGLTDTNIFTQIISVITIIMILDWRMQQRHENMQYQQNIQYVLRDLGNSDAISGMRGAREARAMGLLTDQSLEGADLQYAN
ncbi:MAG: hypothetical protein AAF787_21120, partial [Chloroflexota bacterium]